MSRTSKLAMREVSRSFASRGGWVHALWGVSFDLAPGTFTALMGPSGSGKTTLVNCAVGVDRPSSGGVFLDGTDLGALNDRQLAVFRRSRVGFVYQDYALMEALTVGENIELPSRIAKTALDRDWVRRLAERTGIDDLLGRRIDQLSGGQQQRVAIVRALSLKPAVVVADEPTGALDPASAREITSLLRDLAGEYGNTILMITHDPLVASRADRVLVLSKGRIDREVEGADPGDLLDDLLAAAD
ncbi:ABC transporter ATP-binding protein [Glycomyces salinus]|uniref:ABC transporter ATP-binding protein n=1 Tax=Glycomyces salinus TaxID=980294 RepID=UPI0018ECE642|nr:ABC transporter ATP-binding protein [Glycomyces salinus]